MEHDQSNGISLSESTLQYSSIVNTNPYYHFCTIQGVDVDLQTAHSSLDSKDPYVFYNKLKYCKGISIIVTVHSCPVKS